jgi:endoglucanase
MNSVPHAGVRRWRICVAAFFATAMVAVLYPVAPATAASPDNPAQFKGVNWADPRDNFADDAVVPSGLSVDDRYGLDRVTWGWGSTSPSRPSQAPSR